MLPVPYYHARIIISTESLLLACSWPLKEELQATMYVSQCDGARSYRMITILREMVLFPALSLLK